MNYQRREIPKKNVPGQRAGRQGGLMSNWEVGEGKGLDQGGSH